MRASLARNIVSRRAVTTCNPVKVQRRWASHGETHYNQPTGYLFGEKPPPPGQKRVKEDWEDIYMWGMFGGMAFAALALLYKPDTSVQSWALKEAKKRVEGEEKPAAAE